MRTVVAVDWSKQSFNAVKVVCRLFTHESLTLIHAVDLRPFETPLFAQPLGRKSPGALREGMVAAGERLLDQTGALAPVTIPSIQGVYNIGNPASWCSRRFVRLVLTWLRSVTERGRLAELVLGSVSHRVVLHGPCAALLVRDDAGRVQRVLLTAEEHEDSLTLCAWLSAHRFSQPIALSLLTVYLLFLSAIRRWNASMTNGRRKWTSMSGSLWTKRLRPCEPSLLPSARKSSMVIRLIALPR